MKQQQQRISPAQIVTYHDLSLLFNKQSNGAWWGLRFFFVLLLIMIVISTASQTGLSYPQYGDAGAEWRVSIVSIYFRGDQNPRKFWNPDADRRPLLNQQAPSQEDVAEYPYFIWQVGRVPIPSFGDLQGDWNPFPVVLESQSIYPYICIYIYPYFYRYIYLYIYIYPIMDHHDDF